ncbi:hypothetical protein BJP40_30015 [Streptomyces sp. CC53]|uniref:hypothetical protein n=1 Tax=Streptomyces sp. CC53 TaxID=1906740 RepID=UPI0008DDFA3F|nr:hypothetical protein [Streptomyces sp. CC53]OII61882.1 hypothetical protein BJP40_30015 [Streptomyces sp. CC53]
MRRFAMPCVGAAAAAVALAAPAHAAPEPSFAPHTQAAAKVAADGTLLKQKNVVSSSKFQTGGYCVKVGPDAVDLADSIVQVSGGPAGGSTHAYETPTAACGNAADTILVYVRNLNGAAIDAGFTVTVH